MVIGKDLTSSGKVCSTLGVLNRTAGYECYLNLGYSSGCAYTYLYDGIYDQSVCLRPCTTSLGQPNNGPAPECSLNACLQCDEDKAGPIFQQYG